MVRRLILITFFLMVLISAAWSQNTHDDQTLRETVARYGQATVRIPLPGVDALNILSHKISVSTVRGKFAEVVLSPRTVEWFILQKFDYSLIAPSDGKGIQTASSLQEAKGWTTYPKYSQYIAMMNDFVQQHPSLCKLDTIGQTIDGRLMLALKISDNPGTNEDEPEVFYSSTIHGNETGGYVLMLRFADYLLNNYSSSAMVKNLVDNEEIWINPLANPDGTYRSGDSIVNPMRYNENFVDLNRNFPDPRGIDDPQQKETTNMVRFMKSHHFVISANFHAGEEVVNYPWDRWSRLHADDAWLNDISRKYADTVHIYSPLSYMSDFDNGITNGYQWYSIRGGRQDYMTYSRQGREVTIELDYTYVSTSAGLQLLWQYNWKSLLGYLENALYGIHGHVTERDSGKPLEAMIFINGHDKDSSMVFSDSLTGSFTRLIAPGLWDLTFSAKGYYSNTVTGVTVVDGLPVNLDVKLIPLVNEIDTVQTPVIVIYPVPSSDFVRMILPDRLTGNVNVRIFNSAGIEISEFDSFTIVDSPLEYNVGNFASGWYTVRITNKINNLSKTGRFIVVKK